MNDRRSYEQEKKVIEDAIDAALNKRVFPCAIQAEQMEQMRLAITTLVAQMTGNGTPQNGIIYRFSLVEARVKDLVKERWLVISVVAGLLLVSVWELISK